jgi:hypothetical protein
MVDTAFKFLTSSKDKVAVKVYAMQVLANACKQYPQLKTELVAAIEHEMNKNTIAFYARAKRVIHDIDPNYNPKFLKNFLSEEWQGKLR